MKYLIPLKGIQLEGDTLLLSFKGHKTDRLPLNTGYFFKRTNEGLNLSFYNKFDYMKFFSKVNEILKRNFIIFFVKFKLKGLGYRFKRMSKYLYRFYFTRTSYLYLHRPKNVIIKHRKKRIIMLSMDKQRLHMVFNSILYLHKVGPYNRRGFLYPRNLVLKKPGKKIV